MNTRPIKGHVNLSTLHNVVSNFGGMDQNDLDQQLLWIAGGIRAAKGKITRAQAELKAAKYLLRRRNILPKEVVALAIKAKAAAQQQEYEAVVEKHQFMERYRNFRSIQYIQKSLDLLNKAE